MVSKALIKMLVSRTSFTGPFDRFLYGGFDQIGINCSISYLNASSGLTEKRLPDGFINELGQIALFGPTNGQVYTKHSVGFLRNN